MNNIKKKEKTSQYKGVYMHKHSGKWHVQLSIKGQKQKYGGYFMDELDAAKRVNQLCEELGIPLQIPGVEHLPSEKSPKKEKISQYKGVYWHKQVGKWYALIYPKGQKRKYGGMFKNELNAAKRVNQLYEEIRISSQHPVTSAISNQNSPK